MVGDLPLGLNTKDPERNVLEIMAGTLAVR